MLASCRLLKYRLCIFQRAKIPSIYVLNKGSNVFDTQKRQFSLREVVENLAKTQTGIFKQLSESTPVEYLQNFLVSFHETTGLPWWATIVCTTILLRSCVTVPLAIHQQYILAKVEKISLEFPPIVEEIKREIGMAVHLFKWDERVAKHQFKRAV